MIPERDLGGGIKVEAMPHNMGVAIHAYNTTSLVSIVLHPSALQELLNFTTELAAAIKVARGNANGN